MLVLPNLEDDLEEDSEEELPNWRLDEFAFSSWPGSFSAADSLFSFDDEDFAVDEEAIEEEVVEDEVLDVLFASVLSNETPLGA